MAWKRFAWMGCLAPLIGGCLGVHPAHRDRLGEAGIAMAEKEVGRRIHHQAHAAWQTVRSEHPGRAFSPEFHDGFIDGYSDYLDRGGDGQPPAVPPLRYTRNKKYYTPEGHVLMRDYFLGFKYGAEIAIASGQRQFFTVPVLIPEKIEGVTFSAVPVGEGEAPSVPGSDAPVKVAPSRAVPRPMSRLPMPRSVANKPSETHPNPPQSKFNSAVSRPTRDDFGIPPLGEAEAPAPATPPVPTTSVPMLPVGLGFSIPLAPGNGVEPSAPPERPASPEPVFRDRPLETPLPPNLEEFAPLPANHSVPPPLPPRPPEADKK